MIEGLVLLVELHFMRASKGTLIYLGDFRISDFGFICFIP